MDYGPKNCIFGQNIYFSTLRPHNPLFWPQTDPTQWYHIFPMSWGNSGCLQFSGRCPFGCSLMRWRSTDDQLMMSCWWADDQLMMSWWWADDELMMNWWWTDDELMMNWWWTDDELMMSWWWADDELMMSWWWAGDELMMNWWCTSNELMMNWWWTEWFRAVWNNQT